MTEDSPGEVLGISKHSRVSAQANLFLSLLPLRKKKKKAIQSLFRYGGDRLAEPLLRYVRGGDPNYLVLFLTWETP
jgi:hypothetical protein